VERGYVFLRNEAGEMLLALGRDNKGEGLTDETTLSHGAMRQAISTSNEFIVTDTLSADPETRSASMVAYLHPPAQAPPRFRFARNRAPRPPLSR
jgi:hypothetical protein